MLTPTKTSYQQHVQPIINIKDLPPLSVPRGVNGGERMEPKKAIGLLEKSQAGFIGKKIAYLVAQVYN